MIPQFPKSSGSGTSRHRGNLKRQRLHVECLEHRYLLCDLTVTSPGGGVTDAEGLTLASALLSDQFFFPGPSRICFNIRGGGQQTIQLTDPLPGIHDPVFIDGWSQGGPGYSGPPLIEIDGSATIGSGLFIAADATRVRGLAINGNSNHGIWVLASDVVIEDNYIGIDLSGMIDRGNGFSGVLVNATDFSGNPTSGNFIRRNVISGNDQHGVVLSGAGNYVAGNKIGTTTAGEAAVPNSGAGVLINNSADNTIGTDADGVDDADERNIISGNTQFGVWIFGSGATNNKVQGNYIGTNAEGTDSVGNDHGILIQDAPNNTIGGTTTEQRNVISGNQLTGIWIQGQQSTENKVQGNYIGTERDGTCSLGSDSTCPMGNTHGILIDGAEKNTIGGTTTEERNVISGNRSNGIWIHGEQATETKVLGNYIGTNADGNDALGNGDGILIDGAPKNTIGGTKTEESNVISANRFNGIWILGAQAAENKVQGNYIGTNKDGNEAVGNDIGVRLEQAPKNTIGGAEEGARNIIAGNEGDGIRIEGDMATENQVAGNHIGTSIDSESCVGNMGNGIAIIDASSNLIGGVDEGATNVIGGNGVEFCVGVAVAAARTRSSISAAASSQPAGNGIFIEGEAAKNNHIFHQFIGIMEDGTPKGNAGDGVLIRGASNNRIGGTTPGQRNYIAANGGAGVRITNAPGGTPAATNIVEGNYIGTDKDGNPKGNERAGVLIEGASNNTVGGTDGENTRNVISANKESGIEIHMGEDGTPATGNHIEGNYIGTDILGASGISAAGADMGNLADGVAIIDASENTIGGTDPGAGNIIANNHGNGIRIEGMGAAGNRSVDMNVVQGNYIGVTGIGLPPLGNRGDGILIENSSNNTIGGAEDGARNIITGSLNNGVTVTGHGTENRISRNKIFENHRLGIKLGDDDGRVTPNHTGRQDGPNNFQNYPVLHSVMTSEDGRHVSIEGTIHSAVGGTYKLEFYANRNVNDSFFSEGEYFMGERDVFVAGGDALTEFQVDFDAPLIPAGAERFVTATATDPQGNTSPFSACRDLLRDTVHFGPTGTPRIDANFRPFIYPPAGVNSLDDVARICEVDHFNWVQKLTHIPDHWILFRFQGNWLPTLNQNPVDGSNPYWHYAASPFPKTFFNPPMTDPIENAPPNHYGIISHLARSADPRHYPAGEIPIGVDNPPSSVPFDGFEYYYDEQPAFPGFYRNQLLGDTLTYFDQPLVPAPFYPPQRHRQLRGLRDSASRRARGRDGRPMAGSPYGLHLANRRSVQPIR